MRAPDTEKTPSPPLDRLAMIDALRGIAALWVALFHLSEGKHIPSLLAWIPPWARLVFFEAGHLGVPVFFVLSGVVMVVTTRFVTMSGPNARRFLARRLLRLAPPYYLAILVGLASIAVKHLTSQTGPAVPALRDLLAHALFVQDMLGFPQILTVFWTLCIEVQFYAAFALMLWLADKWPARRPMASRERLSLIIAIASLLWPAGLIHSIGWSGGFIGFWFSFMAGVLCGQMVVAAPHARPIAVLYCTALLLLGLIRSDSFATAAAITGLAFCLMGDFPGLSQWLGLSPLRLLGTISYSLYLFHLPVTGSFMRLFRKFLITTPLTDVLALCLSMTACIGFAAISYWTVERPAQAWSRRIHLPPASAQGGRPD